MKDNVNGYLELILGPMFSGKTSKLIEIYKQYAFCGMDTLVINHSHDIRYDKSDTIDKKLYTHDHQYMPCIQSDTLQSVLYDNIDLFTNSKTLAVFINEGQFFPDLFQSVLQMVREHKAHVYIAGLDGDFKREKFGEMLELIPLCDQVYKLQSLCVYCKDGTKAIFSHRINRECNVQTQIGAQDIYVPLCRKCYEKAYT